MIECEFEDTKTVPLGYTFHDLSKYLVDKGYQVYVSEWHPITRYGIPHDWRALMRYPWELADPKGWGNLLAFRTAPPSAWPRPTAACAPANPPPPYRWSCYCMNSNPGRCLPTTPSMPPASSA